MKSRFGIISDFVISRLLIFVAVFVWVRFSVRQLWLSILLSVAITAGISVILTVLFRTKKEKKKTSREREAKKQEMLNQFLYNDSVFALDFFAGLLSSKHKVDKTPAYLVIDERLILFSRIALNPLSATELCGIFAVARRNNYNKIAVFTYAAHKDTAKIINTFPDLEVDIYDAEMVYSLMEKFDVFPTVKINVKKQKMHFRDMLPLIFNRGKVKGYILTALVMLTGSIFMPFSIYYTVMSSLLILMAVLSFTEIFRPRRNPGRKEFL